MSPESVPEKRATSSQLAIVGFVAGVVTVVIIALIYF